MPLEENANNDYYHLCQFDILETTMAILNNISEMYGLLGAQKRFFFGLFISNFLIVGSGCKTHITLCVGFAFW